MVVKTIKIKIVRAVRFMLIIYESSTCIKFIKNVPFHHFSFSIRFLSTFGKSALVHLVAVLSLVPIAIAVLFLFLLFVYIICILIIG